jgi:hypothetical protein
MLAKPSLFFGLVLILASSLATADDDALRYSLASVAKNQRLESFEVSNKTLTDLKIPGPWSVKQETLHGGKQEGVHRVTIDNGKLKIVVIATRGMSVFEVRHGDLRLGWDSPVKELVHPNLINLERRGGLGWLEGFNEWMVRCGLEFAGHPGMDEFIDNTGATQQMNLTLHGKIGNIPASEVELLIDRKPPHRIRLRGTVHERSFYGPKLELVAEISTEPDADTFRITDQVTNHGATDQEFQLIYHANYGRPLLEQGSKAIVAAERIAPMNDHAAPAISGYAEYVGPTKCFIEQVYLVHPLSDADGRTQIVLKNAAGDRASSIAWNVRELPYLTIWKNTAAVEDGYVTGLEPATGFPYNRRVERKAGRLAKLSPGQQRSFTLDFGLHLGADAVSQAESAVTKLTAGREPILEKSPPKIPE